MSTVSVSPLLSSDPSLHNGTLSELEPEFPSALKFLFQSARYKVAYGGRGAAKSWGFARALLIQGVERPLRVLCARETMQSIAESVHQLLSDQIQAMSLQARYDVQKSKIFGRNGSQFAFAGLRHNVSEIKSYENFDIAWVEEAQAVSNSSWETLIPTIRRDGSEIWVSFNPELATDDTYQRFIITPPPGAVVRRLTWRDNPWFPGVLRAEMEHLKATDPQAYEHVWEGLPKTSVHGAIYQRELAEAEKAGRITRIAYDPTKPVDTFWDLGYGDSTSIWLGQVFPWEYRIIDYIEGSEQPLAYYQKELQERPYVYGRHFLPWDAKPKQLGSGKSIQELLQASGFRVEIVPNIGVDQGIRAVRTIFPQVWFDGEKCADGLQALRHYRWAPDGSDGQIKSQPLHDWASHPADAFRYFAVGVKAPKQKKPQETRTWKPASAWS